MGSRSARILANAEACAVRGVTSRGIYLLAGQQAIVFLTRDPTHGPFTINIPGLGADPAGINPGDRVPFEGQTFLFEAGLLAVATGQAEIWEPAQPAQPLAAPHQIATARIVARDAIERKGWVGLAGLLPGLLGLDDLIPPDPDPLQMDRVARDCLVALQARDAPQLEAALRQASGRGPGLTPSGDDLCAGVLLAMKRGSNRAVRDLLDRISPGLIRHAYAATTAYSANLIEAAAAGEADERLIAACDCITCGIPGPEAAVEGVIRWGSSSRLDMLTGICLTCLAGG